MKQTGDWLQTKRAEWINNVPQMAPDQTVQAVKEN
jgi:hypothetical protein